MRRFPFRHRAIDRIVVMIISWSAICKVIHAAMTVTVVPPVIVDAAISVEMRLSIAFERLASPPMWSLIPSAVFDYLTIVRWEVRLAHRDMRMSGRDNNVCVVVPGGMVCLRQSASGSAVRQQNLLVREHRRVAKLH